MIESLAVLRGADHSVIIAALQNVWLYRDSVSANQRLMAFISLIHQLIRFYWCNEYFGAGLKFLISNREHLDQVRDTHALYRQNPNPTLTQPQDNLNCSWVAYEYDFTPPTPPHPGTITHIWKYKKLF